MSFTKIYDEEKILEFIYNNYDKMSQFEIADYFGCSRSTINFICMKYDIRKHKIHYIPLKDEILKPMKEYRYLYGITNKGRVVNLTTNTVLTNKVSNGYWYTTIQIDKKMYNIRIHRMIAIYFVKGRTKEMDCVNHIDGNKLNNNLSNLEWISKSNNIKHAYANNLTSNKGENNPSAKLTVKDVNTMREDFKNFDGKKKDFYNKYAQLFNLSPGHIINIVYGRYWDTT